MSKKSVSALDSALPEKSDRPKFSQCLTSDIVIITVAKSVAFKIHSSLLITESEKYSKSLTGPFKEAAERTINEEDEDPGLFGFFVEYIYRDRSVLSRPVQHYSEYVTLARLYAMGERLMASPFQACCLWRFTDSLTTRTEISAESICSLLEIACTEISERMKEDPMRSQIFWYGATKISKLRGSSLFRHLLDIIPDLGKNLCLWTDQEQPRKAVSLNELQYERFAPESEYCLKGTTGVATEVEE